MNINFMPTARQRDCFARKASLAFFKTTTKREEDYSKPIAIPSGIVQQLFSETIASEKKLIGL